MKDAGSSSNVEREKVFNEALLEAIDKEMSIVFVKALSMSPIII